VPSVAQPVSAVTSASAPAMSKDLIFMSNPVLYATIERPDSSRNLVTIPTCGTGGLPSE
jgi:hypothetical protein